MNERRKNERRRWGRKVTYPFIDSEGVLVTKNRRRKIDRRDVSEETEDQAEDQIEDKAHDIAAEDIAPLAAAASKDPIKKAAKKPDDNTSIDISESKVMELEDALQNDNEPASNIMNSIKDLENEILFATDIKTKSSARLAVISSKNSPADKQAADKKSETPVDEIEVDEKAVEKEEPVTKKASDKPEIPVKKETAKIKANTNTDQKPDGLPELEINTEDAANEKTNGKEITIELSIKGKKHTVTTDKESCVVGRDPSCDIVINNKYVSRAHAKIILKNGKFLVEDNSFNGTYINFNNGQKIHVAKDEQTLMTNGVMSIGKPVDDESKSVIEFKISQ